MNIDFLIIGQGLAGSLLGYQLMQRGCLVTVVDNGLENASQVAAGLINPITGMRFVKATEVDELLVIAKSYYAELSRFYQQDFYIEKPMLRLFNSDKERMNCEKRFTQKAYQAYLGTMHNTIQGIKTPFSCVTQQQTGYLLTRPLLARSKDFFIHNTCYRQQVFDVRDVKLEATAVIWQDIKAKGIIFCEGYCASENPYFQWLPFQAVKGEILTLNHRHTLPDAILNYGHWLIPLSHQQIRIGATFDRKHLNTKPTELGKQTLLTMMQSVVGNFSTQLVAHQAHIRPCTLDKQPFIGLHPQCPQLSIFNGFGAKGSLQIPYYAQQFAELLIKNTPLPKTVDIARYYPHYVSA